MIEHFNDKITPVAKAFTAAKIDAFLLGRPVVKSNVYEDATLSADLVTAMDADDAIPYDVSILSSADNLFLLNIIKSKIFSAL